MKSNEVTLSPYKIKWIAIYRNGEEKTIPQGDIKKLYNQENKIKDNSLWVLNHNTKKYAKNLLAVVGIDESKINEYIGNLVKTKGLKYEYIAYVFTDKQFGNASCENKNARFPISINDYYYVSITKKQSENRIFIKANQ